MPKNKLEKEKIIQELEFGPLQEMETEGLSKLIRSIDRYDSTDLQIRSMSSDYYHWMYFMNPIGPAYVYVCRHKEKIVSSFAMAPKKFRFGRQEKTIGKTMDMYTHKEYQGMGLIKPLMNSVFEAAMSDGIDMWYVTPSVASFPIFLNKLGYVESYQLNLYFQPFRFGKLLSTVLPGMKKLSTILDQNIILKKIYTSHSLPGGYEVIEDNGFGSETDELWHASQDYAIMQVRNASYMQWRYVDNPDDYHILKFYHVGRIKGIIIVKYTMRKNLQVGEIVDFMIPRDDQETFKIAFRYIADEFYKNGCVFGQTWAISNTSQRKKLRKQGFRLKRKKVMYLLSPNARVREFYDKDAWFLTQGDGNDL